MLDQSVKNFLSVSFLYDSFNHKEISKGLLRQKGIAWENPFLFGKELYVQV